ncbi:GNAT family N-acetyltransferase [Thermohalobacter berrensis]|uniref:N-acetyltransferase domain-containing protein n=1 Tax=Thermohalobacter berrensis TaxID=99594 RepID=A0A419SXW4_9FIRM|nr:GNAT family N-acetyltransferase [Thermohalobacter berrensis]RKD30021.1 hypothetical protein BET03_04770 [Thermohalobacter berrensis]
MDFEIEQLTDKDYEDAIDFINMVFSMHYHPINFPELLPTYYQPTDEHMRCHYVVKQDGKIRALVGVYPGKLKIGDDSLKIARIGAVSTHPNTRDRGLMQSLMNYSMDCIKSEEYDLAYLGGLRHRYSYFGFEKCGYKLIFKINKHNLKHTDIENKGFKIKEISEDYKELMEELKSFHDKRPIHFERSKEDFFKICKNWNHKLYVGLKKGKPVGYLVANQDENHIHEIVAETEDITIELIHKFTLENINYSISVDINPIDYSLANRLGNLCEEVEIKNVNNWCIINWESVLNSLLKVKSQYVPLIDGEIIISIEDYGNIKINVKDNNVNCEKTKEEADFRLDTKTLMRMFFGPIKPSLVNKVPKKAQVLESWCPLPLYISMQDFA